MRMCWLVMFDHVLRMDTTSPLGSAPRSNINSSKSSKSTINRTKQAAKQAENTRLVAMNQRIPLEPIKRFKQSKTGKKNSWRIIWTVVDSEYLFGIQNGSLYRGLHTQ